MKCPNCHCEISRNERICRYCGFDVEEFLANSAYGDSGTLHYRDALNYYERGYFREKEKNERYRRNLIAVLIGGVAILNIIQIVMLAVYVLG